MKGPRERVEEWLTRHLMRVKGATNVTVYHVAHGGEGRAKLDVVELAGEDASPDALADAIVAASERDAEGWDRPQQYSAHLYCDAKESDARIVWRIAPAGRSADGETEPPTTQGLVGQGMRHTEALLRLVLQSQESITKALTRQLDSAEKRAAQADNKRIEYVNLIEEITYEKHRRELEIVKAQRQGEMLEEGFKRLMLFAPIIGEKLLGQKAGLTTASKDLLLAASVRDLVSSLARDPKKIEALVMSGAFDPDQLAILQTVVSQVQESSDAQEDKRVIKPEEDE